MTTFSFAALTATFDGVNNDPIGLVPSVVTITTQNENPWVWFDQFVNGPDDWSSFIAARLLNVRVDGVLVDNADLQMTRATWPGGSAIFFAIDGDTVSTVIQVDGTDIPVSTLAELQAWEATATFGPVLATGDFAPGQDILLTAFKGLTGISENDNAVGTALANTRIYLNDGNDSMAAGAGNDEVYGGADQDTLAGEDGDDTLYGDDGRDRLSGGNEDDDLYGDTGNDTLNGDNGFDYVYGGDGDDQLLGGNHSDQLYGDLGNDKIYGGNGNDWRLDGAEGNDLISGGVGSDVLRGRTGNDTLNGDAGADDIAGGMGADLFQFRAGMGRDLVRDFDLAEGDRLQIARVLVDGQTGLTTAQVFAQYGTDLGGSLRFTFAGGHQLTLMDVADVADLGNAISIV